MTSGSLVGTQGRFGRLTRSLAAGAGLAAVRFPIATMLIVAIAILSNLAVRGVFLPDEALFAWLIGALYAAAAGGVVAAIAGEAWYFGALVRLAMSAVTALVVGAAVWFGFHVSVYPPALTAAVTLAIPLAPFFARSDKRRFWTFTFWTTVGTVLAFLSVLLFVAGFSAILEMIRFLFDFGLPANAYEHIFATAFTFVGPLFALGRIPRDFDDAVPLSGDDRLISGVRILFDWVAMPLALATALVLHLYAAKIVLTFDLPRNEIGWIVLFFASLVLALRIAVDPFVERGAAPTRLFAKWFAALLAVPLTLVFYAIALRLQAQGFTLERYYLLTGAVASALIVLAQLVPRLRGDTRLMAAIPVALLAVTAFGPWGAASTVGRSQFALISADLADRGGTQIVPGGADDVRAARLRSRLYALDQSGQLDRVAPLLAASDRQLLADAFDTRPTDAIDVVLTALDLQIPETITLTRSFTAAAPSVRDISGFDRATDERQLVQGANLPQASSGAAESALAPQSVVLSLSGSDIVMRVGAVEDRFDLTRAAAGFQETIYAAHPGDIAAPVATLESAAGRRIRVAIGQLVIEDQESRSGDTSPAGPSAVDASPPSGSPIRFVSARIEIFYRAVDWQPTAR